MLILLGNTIHFMNFTIFFIIDDYAFVYHFLKSFFYIYFPDSQESVGGDIHKETVKQLPRPASGDSKILLPSQNFLFWFFSFYWRYDRNLELLAKPTKQRKVP